MERKAWHRVSLAGFTTTPALSVYGGQTVGLRSPAAGVRA